LNEIRKTSSVSICSTLVSLQQEEESIEISAVKEMTAVVFYDAEASSVEITLLHGGDVVKERFRLKPNERVRLSHKFVLKHERELNDDSPFPFELMYRKQMYHLGRTKAGKLILTK